MRDQVETQREPAAAMRAPWSRPSFARKQGSDAETSFANGPDGVGDQLS